MTHNPLVSVVIPAYNHQDTVARSIRSVLDQTYSPIELIVIDDGSTDGTWREIEHTREASPLPFVTITQQNHGVSATLNRAIRHSSGALIATLASDDWYVLTKIEAQVELFRKSSRQVGLVHSSAYDVSVDGRIVTNHGSYDPATGSCLREILSLKKRIVAPTVMFTREAYDRVGGFDEEMAAEDVDFHAAIAAAGFEIAYDPTPLLYKAGSASSLGSQVQRWFDVHHRTLRKHQHLFSARERNDISRAIYLALGRTALGVGDVSLAYTAFRAAAQLRAPIHTHLLFAIAVGRQSVLRLLPPVMRHALRELRAGIRRR